MKHSSSPVPDIVVCKDKSALVRDAAYRFVALANMTTAENRPFMVALSGGSTPEALYKLLAAPLFRESVDWSQIKIFFGDERCVAPDLPESNFRMANEALLRHVPIPAENVYRIQGELADRDYAARQYEASLRAAFVNEGDQVPKFDLIFLGLGSDGHCASLFPHKPSLVEQRRLLVASEPGLAPFVTRITFTFPLINNSANVMFLVSGEEKAEMAARVLNGPADPDVLPSQRVSPLQGQLIWLLDNEASSRL